MCLIIKRFDGATDWFTKLGYIYAAIFVYYSVCDVRVTYPEKTSNEASSKHGIQRAN